MGYRRVTIRVPQRVARQLREFAKFSGWQLADLQRTLICIGATFFLLSYGNEAGEKAATTLMRGMELLRLSRGFRLTPSRRPYAFRTRLHKSIFATLSLPESVCDVIAAYAGLKHASRNQVYNKCLQQGLLIYLKAQATAFGAEGVLEESADGSGHFQRVILRPEVKGTPGSDIAFSQGESVIRRLKPEKATTWKTG